MSNPVSDNSATAETRTLNVELPASVYWHIRECATLSRLSLKDFMSDFGTTAKPISSVETTGAMIQEDDSESMVSS